MLVKSDQDAIQSFLADASNLAGGHASRVLVPETSEEVADALARATRERTPVTVAGAGTGIVGGRVPFGGVVLSTQRLNRIGEIVRHDHGGRATAGAGVVLADFQRDVRSKGLLYPPDPTESSCFLGGTVATNASGARTFKYGPTRRYVRRLKVALATGDLLDIRRGEIFADAGGRVRVTLGGGRSIDARLPSYTMPATRKHAAGYYVAPGMDLIDLFVGSEGTLGVITEAEVSLLARPEGVLSGVVFFRDEDGLLAFVREARERSLRTRTESVDNSELTSVAGVGASAVGLDARALEYFDEESLKFLRERYPLVPLGAAGAVFFEQGTTRSNAKRLAGAGAGPGQRPRALGRDPPLCTDEHSRAPRRTLPHTLSGMM